MQLVFLFPKDQHDSNKAIIAKRICECAALHIKLPDRVEIEFSELENNVYGETSLIPTNSRRIKINIRLSEKEIIFPLVHELIHLNQIHLGQLAVSRSGVAVWNGKTYKIDPKKMSKNQYLSLPWEEDVRARQDALIKQILDT